MIIRRLFSPLSLLAMGIVVGSCLPASRCIQDKDCLGRELCNRQEGICEIECQVAQDCLDKYGLALMCADNRCQLPTDARVTAPNFCLNDVNPRSSTVSQEICLRSLKGKVVLVYFALMH